MIRLIAHFTPVRSLNRRRIFSDKPIFEGRITAAKPLSTPSPEALLTLFPQYFYTLFEIILSADASNEVRDMTMSPT
ncbi:MAG: hypothetical protein ACRD96_03135, partial [Bryobacteraceae bacterium]